MATSSQSSTAQTDSTIPLLHAAKRVLSLPRLPPYATDLVRSLVREVRDRDAIVNQLLAEHAQRRSEGASSSFDPNNDPEMATRLLVELLGMRRGKRCLLGYHSARVGVIEERLWEGKEEELLGVGADVAGGGAASPAGGGENEYDAAQTNLSPEEEDYARRYAELLAGLKGQWTDVDLTGSLEPPRDLFTDVRVLKDAGVVQTEYGELNLTKNSQFFVRVGDVEGLIRSGYLKRLS